MATHPGRDLEPSLPPSGIQSDAPPPAASVLVGDSLAPLTGVAPGVGRPDAVQPLSLGRLLGAGAGIALMMFASGLQLVTARALAPASPTPVAALVAAVPTSEPVPMVAMVARPPAPAPSAAPVPAASDGALGPAAPVPAAGRPGRAAPPPGDRACVGGRR